MKLPKRLEYWKSVAVDTCRAAGADVAELEEMVFEDEYALSGYFGYFRPEGKGVERVFAGIVGGEEIVQRLRRIYDCTRDESGLYFVVRQPVPATAERLVELTRQHLLKVKQIARAFGHDGLTSQLKVLPEIKIKRQAIPDETRCNPGAPESDVYHVTGDWFGNLEPAPSDALWLHEAFYSIAADYKIAHYLLWPLHRQSTDIEDPFAPYFELRTHGALPFFEKPGLVNVYVRPKETTP
jgi:hypothetical protein